MSSLIELRSALARLQGCLWSRDILQALSYVVVDTADVGSDTSWRLMTSLVTQDPNCSDEVIDDSDDEKDETPLDQEEREDWESRVGALLDCEICQCTCLADGTPLTTHDSKDDTCKRLVIFDPVK